MGLASVHTIARVAERGDRSAWELVAPSIKDADELVRVGAVRAIGRIAEVGDGDALALLRRTQKDTPDESVRMAARDAEVRLLGTFGLPGGETLPLLGGRSD